MGSTRPRNAADTREAILQSAIRHFALSGYDGVGVREIARGAGVTAMLVNRYFGSKEQLFAEAVETSFAPPAIVGEQPDTLARDMATALVERSDPDADPLEPFLIMLRSVSNPVAVDIVRDAIARHVGRRLGRQLAEPGRRLRTDAMLSLVSGVLLMRRVMRSPGLTECDTGQLTELFERLFSTIIDADLG
ncbi:TetR/AcrR family transcriptional regulator [Mycobacterium sp. URHD0025]|uniref:TetR/AcrR family transcriptional regulator n=1 Tax=Mycobacterium sp. URHD0025 TaxID=1298864 RepID=UPI0004032CB5|nr:TetR/AcrR family transcriptional regulator [Mycobacterium sp. URHD0025]